MGRGGSISKAATGSSGHTWINWTEGGRASGRNLRNTNWQSASSTIA